MNYCTNTWYLYDNAAIRIPSSSISFTCWLYYVVNVHIEGDSWCLPYIAKQICWETRKYLKSFNQIHNYPCLLIPSLLKVKIWPNVSYQFEIRLTKWSLFTTQSDIWSRNRAVKEMIHLMSGTFNVTYFTIWPIYERPVM